MRPLLPIIILAAAGTICRATPVVSCDTTTLLPNTPGQLLTISVTGGDPVDILDFHVFLDNAVGTPAFTGLDLVTGTIFAGNNSGQYNDAVGVDNGYPGHYGASIPAESGTVAANGRLATLTVDTTGFAVGNSFTLGFVGNLEGLDLALNFGTPDITLNSQLITIVPEPTSLAILAIGAITLLRRRRD